jgi:Uma2 family endonuclease
MASTRVITDEELLRLPQDGCRYEVVDGELVRMSPAGWWHEQIIVRLGGRLTAFVEPRGLGVVLGSNVMYILPTGNKRCPDLSFVAAGRLPAAARQTAFPALAPDLAVEVVSPADAPRLVLDKVGEYLQAGVRLVWVIDPEAGSAAIYRSMTSVREVAPREALDGEDVIPGFSCLLAEILG